MPAHDGSTPAAWTAVTLVLIALLVGAAGLIMDNWVIFWVGAGLLVASLLIAKVMHYMGLGAR